MKSIINQGAGAFLLGRPLGSNPYQGNQPEHGHWKEGWRRQLLLETMLDPEVVYENPWFKVEKVQNNHWVTLSNDKAAAILPLRIVNDQHQVLLVNQFRHLAGGMQLGLPRGGGEVIDRDTKATASRELREETGYAVPDQRIEYLSEVHTDSGLVKRAVPFYLAWVQETDRVTDVLDEVDEILWYPIDEVRAMIAQGAIKDSFTICALMLFDAQGRGQSKFPENFLG